MMKAYLLPQVDAAERSHVARFVFPEHFAHGAGGRLTGEAVDVDPLLFVILTHELLLLLRLHGDRPGTDTKSKKG